MFELLFKYSRATFERSDLVFASGWPVWVLVALIVAAAVAVGVTLARRRVGFAIPKLVSLGVLQTLLIAALLVLAWRPALVTQTLRPQENSVAVLLDTSGSMLYGDGTRSRLQEAVDALSARALPDLKSTFNVSLFSFAGDLIELPSLEQVPAPGPVTHIGDALLSVLRGAQSGAIAAVVLVSDGADNSPDFDAAKIAEIASFGVPVHTVGVGAEQDPKDLELEDVQVAPVGLPGSTVSAQVSIRHSGSALAQLKVYDGDAILASRAIQLPNTTGVTTRWVDLEVGKPGVRDLKFVIDALPGETNVINNAQMRPMEVPEQRRHILYIEGEPRWEYKFIRRALEDDSPIRVASLLKTTPNKFYRQG
ncbi:MAG TPA: vWA domain-containing protein, partial [Gammaproteobacteria bacterium]|nr:vWA domain-containing protein [Gammaproteobacteria bacterium]